MSDLIDRDKVIEYCLKLIDVERKQGSDVMNYGQERINQTDTIIAFVENLPSARPKGEWIEMGQNEDGTHNVKCNQCDSAYKMRGHAKSISTKLKYRFCPHCGARMKGADDETD